MYPIVEKQELAPAIKLMVVEAPNAARKARAGQFVIVRIDEPGERIPLTIADHDAGQGTVTLIFQEVGKSTMQMGTLAVGDALATVAGPLGHPTEIAAYGTVVCLGGGVGIAPIFPIARALKEAGNRVVSIIGARSRDLLFWEDRMRSVSDELIVCTDDGSYGRPGLVTAPLRELLEQRPGAFEYALPVRQWRQKWTPEYEKMLDLLRQTKPDGRGVREFVSILKLHRDHPADMVNRAVKQALDLGAAHLDGVQLCLRQLLSPQECPPALILDHPRLAAVGYQPVRLEQYNQLLEARS